MERCVTDSPLGRLLLMADDMGLCALTPTDELPCAPGTPLLAACVRQLEEYFHGERTVFDLPLHPQGTSFRLLCWEALQAIPFGQTRTYAQQAAAIGNAKAVRAVGGADHHNPIMIIIPCHRVIGADGSLTGYAGGLEMKDWLLAHERSVLAAGLG